MKKARVLERIAGARPVRTQYRGGRVGHSATVQGALRAASMRIVRGEFTGATIWDEYGSVAHVIKRKGRYTLITKH